MENPYSATEHAAAASLLTPTPSLPRWRWKRLLAWTLMTQLAMIVTSIAMGVLAATIMLEIESPQRYDAVITWLRLLVVDIVLAGFYAGFLMKVVQRRILHLLMMFALLIGLDMALSMLVFGAPREGQYGLGWLLRASVPMLAGAALVWLYERFHRGDKAVASQ